MRKIAATVYDDLTPRQRIVASIEAEARHDEGEKRRLITSCPKVTYSSTDARFSETMEKLFSLAMAVEADLRGFALAFLIGVRVDPKNAIQLLQPYADLRAAWNSVISEMGIDPKSMKLAGPPQSPVFDLIADIIPKPNKKQSKVLEADMLDLIGSAKL